MAELNPPYALQNAGATHTAAGDRLMVTGLLAGGVSGSAITNRGGVSPNSGSEMSVSQTGTPSMAVIVASGICYVSGTSVSAQGTYACVNDSNETVTITSAHGSQPRVDSIIARVYDSQYSGSADEWALEVVTGTAASSPVAPTIPENSLLLANVNVGAAVTSITNANIVDRRTWVTAAGGIIPVRNQTERDALQGLPTAVPTTVYRLDTGLMETRHNGTWQVKTPQQIIISNQISDPPHNVTGTYVDFTSGQWPAITFTAPQSGRIRVTVSAAIANTNTTNSTSWATYRISGALTYSANIANGLSVSGGRVYAERSRVFTGLTAGASCTITPQWNISSGNSSTALCTGGQLQVELLP